MYWYMQGPHAEVGLQQEWRNNLWLRGGPDDTTLFPEICTASDLETFITTARFCALYGIGLCSDSTSSRHLLVVLHGELHQPRDFLALLLGLFSHSAYLNTAYMIPKKFKPPSASRYAITFQFPCANLLVSRSWTSRCDWVLILLS